MADPGELTAELRLWWRGQAPEAVASWFASGNPSPVETRTDTYLLTGNAALGIKQRGEGSGLECKSLVAVAETGLPWGAGELWVECTTSSAGLPTGRLLDVTKTRQLHTIAAGNGEVTCEVELGVVQPAGGETWATLCFEAQAELGDPARHLRAAWAQLAPPADCDTGLAASYPAWLERHACA